MHTEGKWTVKREGNFDTISIESNIKSDSNLFKHDVICIFSKPNRESNANRIVQAANSFDGLLDALKDANQLLGGLPYKNSETEEEIVEGRRKLGQAIAQAEMK